jgi:H+/Cl- antiporter ClcA
MSMQHVAEVSTAATVAGATMAGAVSSADLGGLMSWLVPLGAASVVGYFSAQLTVRSELAELRTELRLIRHELHRYYPTRGEVAGHRYEGEER